MILSPKPASAIRMAAMPGYRAAALIGIAPPVMQRGEPFQRVRATRTARDKSTTDIA